MNALELTKKPNVPVPEPDKIKSRKHAARAGSVVLSVLLCGAVAFVVFGKYLPARAIAKPQFPKDQTVASLEKPFAGDIRDFSSASASAVLSGGSEKNTLYSPISLYMTMAMLADGANGDTRREILQALALKNLSMSDIEQQSALLYRNFYIEKDSTKLKLENSLWMDKSVAFKKSFLESVAENFYAYSFRENFNSPRTSDKIANWVSDATGKKVAFSVPTDGGVMQVINTIDFNGLWEQEFEQAATKNDAFSLAGGGKTECNFMNAAFQNHSFYKGSQYTVSGVDFKNGLSMEFILPDKGIEPENLLKDPAMLSAALGHKDEQKGIVTFEIPKFNYTTQTNLTGVLKKLGVQRAFETKAADFSNLSDTKPLFLSDVVQESTITIDENGCRAGVCTEAAMMGASAEYVKDPPHADMILTRPFIIAVTGADDIPLFVGVINNPTACP